MADEGSLTICVVCARGIDDIEGWGKGVCVSMDDEAAGFPGRFVPFAKSAFAKSGEGEGVVVLHAVVPEGRQEEYAEALAASCGTLGSIGACVASVDADDATDHADGIARLRAYKANSGGSTEELAGIGWVRTLPLAGEREAALREAAHAAMLLIDFLDVQFDFANDIESFLRARRSADGAAGTAGAGAVVADAVAGGPSTEEGI